MPSPQLSNGLFVDWLQSWQLVTRSRDTVSTKCGLSCSEPAAIGGCQVVQQPSLHPQTPFANYRACAGCLGAPVQANNHHGLTPLCTHSHLPPPPPRCHRPGPLKAALRDLCLQGACSDTPTHCDTPCIRLICTLVCSDTIFDICCLPPSPTAPPP
jgi:hypothetical protein